MKIKTITFRKWKYRNWKSVFLSSETINKTLIVDPEHFIIIDTRDQEDYAKSHLFGSKNVGLPFVETHIEELEKKQPILLVSTFERTNAIFASKARYLGYKSVFLWQYKPEEIDEKHIVKSN